MHVWIKPLFFIWKTGIDRIIKGYWYIDNLILQIHLSPIESLLKYFSFTSTTWLLVHYNILNLAFAYYYLKIKIALILTN